MSGVKLRRWFERPVGGSWGSSPGVDERDAICIRGTDLVFDRLGVDVEKAPLRSFSVEDVRRRSLRSGDIVIEKSGGGENQPVGRVGLFVGGETAVPTNFAARLRPLSTVDSRYAAYVLASLYFAGRTTAAIKQTTGIQNLDLDELLTNRAWLPPMAEQRAIADYLDAETARIDALITKKQQLINLLDERWVARRNSSILHGVDPTSGTGPLPDGWSCPQLGVTIELQRGHDLPSDARRPGKYPIVSSGGISGYHDKCACRGPAVVTGRYGTVGEVFFVNQDCWPLNTTLYVSDFRGNDARWVAFMLESLPLDAESEKSAVGGINRNVIGKLRVPRPALAEQRKIAAELAQSRAVQEVTVRAIQRQIDLLAEHRQALITAAVTGELAVSTVP